MCSRLLKERRKRVHRRGCASRALGPWREISVRCPADQSHAQQCGVRRRPRRLTTKYSGRWEGIPRFDRSVWTAAIDCRDTEQMTGSVSRWDRRSPLGSRVACMCRMSLFGSSSKRLFVRKQPEGEERSAGDSRRRTVSAADMVTKRIYMDSRWQPQSQPAPQPPPPLHCLRRPPRHAGGGRVGPGSGRDIPVGIRSANCTSQSQGVLTAKI